MATSSEDTPCPLPQARCEEGLRGWPTSAPRGGPIHNLIVLRAHRKWIEGGCKVGTEVEDWLAAEAEVKAEVRQGRQY